MTDTVERTPATAWLAKLWPDVLLGAAGTAMGWISLYFPFGRDQGLYYYVAREWVLRGAIPYKDTLDHKTPGIYMVHALAIRLFGEGMWGIRVLELCAVLATGLLAATFTAQRGEPVARGIRGASILAVNVLFFGFLSFWDTSQSEIWYSLLGLSSVWAARRLHDERWAAAGAGAFASAAMIMKPPVIWFLLVAVVLLAQRTRETLSRLGRAVGFYTLGVLAVALPVFGYFGIKGALPELYAIVIRSNAYYVEHEAHVHGLDEFTQKVVYALDVYDFVIIPLILGLVAVSGFAVGRGERALRDRHFLALALGAAGLAAVVMQKKFFLLHWAALIGPVTVMCANAAADFDAFIPTLRRRGLGSIAFAALLLWLWRLTPGLQFYTDETNWTLDYVRGRTTREQFTQLFSLPLIGFSYQNSEQVGLWLRDHSEPTDTIVVRGFAPEIYAVAERHYTGRFFWTTFLVSGTRGEDDIVARWYEEDAATLDRTPPRYVVTLTGHYGPDSNDWFYPRGYVLREVMGSYTILERDPNKPSAAR